MARRAASPVGAEARAVRALYGVNSIQPIRQIRLGPHTIVIQVNRRVLGAHVVDVVATDP